MRRSKGRLMHRNVTVAALLLCGLSVLSGVRIEATPRPVASRGELGPEEKNNIRIFNSAKSSVVYISTLERVVDVWTRNVMTVPQGTGSGFIWDEAGHVVTNRHVIENASGAVV